MNMLAVIFSSRCDKTIVYHFATPLIQINKEKCYKVDARIPISLSYFKQHILTLKY